MDVKYVKPKDCINMEELGRPFYADCSQEYLLERIKIDGFKPCYAIRVIFNKKRNRYECFDGNHRLLAAKQLGLEKIPIIDETGKITRTEAIAEGIKANRSHAYYNPMDISQNLNALSKSNSNEKTEKSTGRPETVNLTKLAEQTGMSKKSISQYLQLQRLPKDVQKLIGKSKLGLSLALVLLRLDKTEYSHLISELADEVVSNGISRQELIRKVESITKRGYIQEDIKACSGCHRVFPKDRVSYVFLCTECVDQLRSGKLETQTTADRKKAMQTFLKVRNFAEKLEKNNEKVPNWLQIRVEELHQKWRDTR